MICKDPNRSISIKADVSRQTMQRLVASCPDKSHVSVQSEGYFGLAPVVGLELVSKLAQSDVVEHIEVRCTRFYDSERRAVPA